MTDIKDICHDDIKQFLLLNKIKVSNDEDNYNNAFKLMKNPIAIIEPISILEWMMAYNLMIKNLIIPEFTINNLMDLSIIERNFLARKLGMSSNNINNIINILNYLHKIILVVGELKIPKNKNIYDIFPKEIWIKLLLDLNCRDIDQISEQSNQLKDIIIENNIREKIKMRGFPRSSGHCEAFDVSQLVADMHPELYDGMSFEQVQNYMLNELRNLKNNVVRGDLICYNGLDYYRNNGIFIFDGCDIINLDYDIDDYGALPKEFTVINNGVPIDYWYNTEKNKGIDNNYLVWFDHKSVKKQLIDNIIEIDGDLFTTFEYNDEIYKIYAYKSDFSEELKLTNEKIIDILSGNDFLLFDGEFGDEENTLYITGYNYVQY